MSMVRCDGCERIIDSDGDPDCFVPQDAVHCQWCREAIETPDQEPIGQSINSILSVLDAYMAMANSPLMVKEIEAEAIGIGQILSRAQLILGFLEARKQTGLRIVRNG